MRKTGREVLARIIGDSASLADVANAFTGELDSAQHAGYRWTANVSVDGEVIGISGEIFHDATAIGRFARRLYYEHGAARAAHDILEIDQGHRRRGIAFAHHAKCLRFYDAVGIRFVHLRAAGMGPFVWPAFGFDLEKTRHHQRLLSLLRREGIDPLPAAGPVLAIRVLGIATEDDAEIGAIALAELGRLAENDGEPLPMVLDLRHPIQRALLENRGIVRPRTVE